MPWVCTHGLALFLSGKLENGEEPWKWRRAFSHQRVFCLHLNMNIFAAGCKSAGLDTSVMHSQHIQGTKHSVNVIQQFIILKYQYLSKTCSFSHTGRVLPYLYIHFWARELQRPRELPKRTLENGDAAAATRQLSLRLIKNLINVLQSLPEHFFLTALEKRDSAPEAEVTNSRVLVCLLDWKPCHLVGPTVPLLPVPPFPCRVNSCSLSTWSVWTHQGYSQGSSLMQLHRMILWLISLGLDLNQVGDCCFWPMGEVCKHTNTCRKYP